MPKSTRTSAHFRQVRQAPSAYVSATIMKPHNWGESQGFENAVVSRTPSPLIPLPIRGREGKNNGARAHVWFRDPKQSSVLSVRWSAGSILSRSEEHTSELQSH